MIIFRRLFAVAVLLWAPFARAQQERRAPVHVKVEEKRVAVRIAIAGQQAQFVEQFQSILRAEYQFLRTVCGPTLDQRRQIVAKTEQAVNDAAAAYVNGQQRVLGGGLQRVPARSDPHKLMQEALAAAARPHLSAEQWSRYESEVAKRAAERKRIAVDNLLAKLDGDLVLSADQRHKLRTVLEDNWQDDWGNSLEMWVYNELYIPSVPDRHVVPVLTEGQRKAWADIPRQQNMYYGFFMGAVMGAEPLDPDVTPEQ
jgi:hypothetical protein